MTLGCVREDGLLDPPSGWLIVERRLDGIAADRNGLLVIISIANEADGQAWIHVSCSRAERIPSWHDVRSVKEAWLGDRESYMVFPPADRYVNIHPNVLHLWSPVDAPDGVLPHFEAKLAGGAMTI